MVLALIKLPPPTGASPLALGGVLKREFVEPWARTSICPWKGTASYHHGVVGDQRVAAAVWRYPETKPKADNVRDYVAGRAAASGARRR